MKAFKNKKKSLSPQHILAAWNDEIPTRLILSQQQLASRRQFLSQTMLAIGSVSIAPVVRAKIDPDKTKLKKTESDVSWNQPWLTLSHVQNYLFPRSGEINQANYSPGANDFNAIGYLKTMLNVAAADKDEREFIIKGVSWLDGMANSLFGKPFIRLNNNNREQVLQKISKSKSGESWLSTLLNYIFEALLTDPVYGGNTEQAGWKWLEHQAGFPRPTKDKKYWLLRDNASGSNAGNSGNRLKGAS